MRQEAVWSPSFWGGDCGIERSSTLTSFWSSACWQSPASNPSPPDTIAPAVSHSAAGSGSKTQPCQWARMSLIKQPCWSTWFHRKRFSQCCVATDSLRLTLKLYHKNSQMHALTLFLVSCDLRIACYTYLSILEITPKHPLPNLIFQSVMPAQPWWDFPL